ncbi:MAG: hypothetical protein H7X93_02285 [Sphingomonadaceae bacterium]|nr:hypothetical protein [Sphingomonadaceae bacterium]
MAGPDPHPDSVPQETPPDAVPEEVPSPGQGDVDNPGAVPSEQPGAPGKGVGSVEGVDDGEDPRV